MGSGLFDKAPSPIEVYYPELDSWKSVQYSSDHSKAGNLTDFSGVAAGAGGIMINRNEILIVGGYNPKTSTNT